MFFFCVNDTKCVCLLFASEVIDRCTHTYDYLTFSFTASATVVAHPWSIFTVFITVSLRYKLCTVGFLWTSVHAVCGLVSSVFSRCFIFTTIHSIIWRPNMLHPVKSLTSLFLKKGRLIMAISVLCKKKWSNSLKNKAWQMYIPQLKIQP